MSWRDTLFFWDGELNRDGKGAGFSGAWIGVDAPAPPGGKGDHWYVLFPKPHAFPSTPEGVASTACRNDCITNDAGRTHTPFIPNTSFLYILNSPSEEDFAKALASKATEFRVSGNCHAAEGSAREYVEWQCSSGTYALDNGSGPAPHQDVSLRCDQI